MDYSAANIGLWSGNVRLGLIAGVYLVVLEPVIGKLNFRKKNA